MYVGGAAGSAPSTRFMQSKLSLTLTLRRGNYEAVLAIIIRTLERRAIPLHACRNIARRLKRIETIEHSTVVNACKRSGI